MLYISGVRFFSLMSIKRSMSPSYFTLQEDLIHRIYYKQLSYDRVDEKWHLTTELQNKCLTYEMPMMYDFYSHT